MASDTFVVTRSAVINAPPDRVYKLLSDFRNWSSWSPWEKLDPAMKKATSGAQSGKGAVYEWDGNKKAGKGRMEITDASAPSRVVIKLDFEKPFRASNRTEFALVPQGNGTNVTWTMEGHRPFLMRILGVFFNMDKMIGKDFEEGLANLQRVVAT